MKFVHDNDNNIDREEAKKHMQLCERQPLKFTLKLNLNLLKKLQA